MKTTTLPCLSCKSEITFFFIEQRDIGQLVSIGNKSFTPHRGEAGWVDAECPCCGMYYPNRMVGERLRGSLEGYVILLDNGQDLTSLIEVLLLENERARQIARLALRRPAKKPIIQEL